MLSLQNEIFREPLKTCLVANAAPPADLLGPLVWSRRRPKIDRRATADKK